MHHLLFTPILTALLLLSHLPSLTPATALPPFLPANSRQPHCTLSPAWLTPTFSVDDCPEAIERFLYTDYQRYKRTPYEFHDRNPPPPPRRNPPMLVPRRYAIASCTVVIAMLWDFPADPPLPPLPGDPTGPFQRTDVLSFQDVFDAVRRVSLRCVGNVGDVGWEAVGARESVGVFVVATGSEVERNIRIGVVPSVAGAGVGVGMGVGMEGLLNSTRVGGGGGGGGVGEPQTS